MRIYNGDTLVAESKTNMPDDYLEVVEGTPKELIPYALFGWGEYSKVRVTVRHATSKWFTTRVMPEDRIGADEILKDAGLPCYSVNGLIRTTKGIRPHDPIRIEM